MELKILNTKGKETGKSIKLSDEIFKFSPNDHAIYLDVKRILASNHMGTHKAKERGEIRGSQRKIKKQKGSGTARMGNIKNPILRGGGRAFGPRVRDYDISLNSKQKIIARKSALSYKLKDDGIIVLENLKLKTSKTNEYFTILKNLNLSDKKTLLVTSEPDSNIYLSSRNLKKAKVMQANDLNTYEILNAQNLILLESSVKTIEEGLK